MKGADDGQGTNGFKGCVFLFLFFFIFIFISTTGSSDYGENAAAPVVVRSRPSISPSRNRRNHRDLPCHSDWLVPPAVLLVHGDAHRIQNGIGIDESDNLPWSIRRRALDLALVNAELIPGLSKGEEFDAHDPA
jgi:hypothetical protein